MIASPSPSLAKKRAAIPADSDPEKTYGKNLLTLYIEHLHRSLYRLLSGGILLLSTAGLGHGVQDGCGLGLAAAGAESYCASDRKNQSCDFHRKMTYGSYRCIVKQISPV